MFKKNGCLIPFSALYIYNYFYPNTGTSIVKKVFSHFATFLEDFVIDYKVV